MQSKVSTRIHIETVAKVKEFVRVISEQPLDAELRSGRFVVDAKSIMGIFSLNISEPVELVLSERKKMWRKLWLPCLPFWYEIRRIR